MSITKLNYSEKLQETLRGMKDFEAKPDGEFTKNGFEYESSHSNDKYDSSYRYNGITGVRAESTRVDEDTNAYFKDIVKYGKGSEYMSIRLNENNQLISVRVKMADGDFIEVTNPDNCETMIRCDDGNTHFYEGDQYIGSEFREPISKEAIYVDTEKGETVYGPINAYHDVAFDELQRPITIIDRLSNSIIETFEYDD